MSVSYSSSIILGVEIIRDHFIGEQKSDEARCLRHGPGNGNFCPSCGKPMRYDTTLIARPSLAALAEISGQSESVILSHFYDEDNCIHAIDRCSGDCGASHHALGLKVSGIGDIGYTHSDACGTPWAGIEDAYKVVRSYTAKCGLDPDAIQLYHSTHAG